VIFLVPGAVLVRNWLAMGLQSSQMESSDVSNFSATTTASLNTTEYSERLYLKTEMLPRPNSVAQKGTFLPEFQAFMSVTSGIIFT
jgi:glycerol kinase